MMIEHVLDNDDSDKYISVPAKNILIEFFMQSTVGSTDKAIPVAMMFAMFMAGWPYLWRYINGAMLFRNQNQMILEMMIAPTKMLNYMLNVMLLLMVRSVIWKKM